MSYELREIKLAAYNFTELPNMEWNERMLWLGLAYCYECYRAGEDKASCDELAQHYIDFYFK